MPLGQSFGCNREAARHHCPSRARHARGNPLTKQSLIEWAAHWVPDNPVGQRKRFVEGLSEELEKWTAPTPEAQPNTSAGCFDDASSLNTFRR